MEMLSKFRNLPIKQGNRVIFINSRYLRHVELAWFRIFTVMITYIYNIEWLINCQLMAALDDAE